MSIARPRTEVPTLPPPPRAPSSRPVWQRLGGLLVLAILVLPRFSVGSVAYEARGVTDRFLNPADARWFADFRGSLAPGELSPVGGEAFGPAQIDTVTTQHLLRLPAGWISAVFSLLGLAGLASVFWRRRARALRMIAGLGAVAGLVAFRLQVDRAFHRLPGWVRPPATLHWSWTYWLELGLFATLALMTVLTPSRSERDADIDEPLAIPGAGTLLSPGWLRLERGTQLVLALVGAQLILFAFALGPSVVTLDLTQATPSWHAHYHAELGFNADDISEDTSGAPESVERAIVTLGEVQLGGAAFLVFAGVVLLLLGIPRSRANVVLAVAGSVLGLVAAAWVRLDVVATLRRIPPSVRSFVQVTWLQGWWIVVALFSVLLVLSLRRLINAPVVNGRPMLRLP